MTLNVQKNDASKVYDSIKENLIKLGSNSRIKEAETLFFEEK